MPLYASSFFRVIGRSNGGTFRLRDYPRLVKKCVQVLRIALREFRAYTKYERNRAVVRFSVIPIDSKDHFVPEILLKI